MSELSFRPNGLLNYRSLTWQGRAVSAATHLRWLLLWRSVFSTNRGPPAGGQAPGLGSPSILSATPLFSGKWIGNTADANVRFPPIPDTSERPLSTQKRTFVATEAY